MIDICGIFDFQKEFHSKCVIPFSGVSGFNIAAHDLKEKKLLSGNIFYMERKGLTSTYFSNITQIFIFGMVFTNNKYDSIELKGPKMLQPSEVCDFYNKFNTEMVQYIKGNFVIIVYDDFKKELVFLSSKLNVSPLFYCYKNNNFIFSSSIQAIFCLSDMPLRLNERAAMEQVLFYHPLSDRTYFKDIFQFPPATILKVNQSGLKTKKYWDTKSLVEFDKLIPEDDALRKCLDLMRKNINLCISDTDIFLISLTGGFDSRTNLALLDRSPKDFLCYSYGMPGSKQIKIPTLISEALGLNYKAIFLEKDFEEKYEEYALKALEYSDGTAPISHANFPYALEKLSTFSKINITGLFGSEIIKPFYKANEQLSQEAINLFLSNNFDKEFSKTIAKLNKKWFLQPNIINKYAEEIREDFRKKYISGLAGFDKRIMLYIFFIEEAIRKYFMREIRIERYCVDTRIPYFDDDFLELIFKTPFSAICKGIGKKNIFSRRNSQVFYAKIIQAAKPVLGNIITDRGYVPHSLLLPPILRAVKILPAYLKQKMFDRIKNNDTFKTEQWTKNIISKYIGKLNNDDIFSSMPIKNFANNVDVKDNFRFLSVFSLRLWLYLLKEKEK
ncbi:MAG: hypothetical protein WC330_02965 [Candidatus Omnitrophota bacterium]|jgi:asparagine synthetase B (glutamine-hydrolysing)